MKAAGPKTTKCGVRVWLKGLAKGRTSNPFQLHRFDSTSRAHDHQNHLAVVSNASLRDAAIICLLQATPADTLQPFPMTLEARSVSVPSLGLFKMEDTRKRTVPADPDEALPPPKRQATLVNGNKSEPFADWDPNMEVRGQFPRLFRHCFTVTQRLGATKQQLQVSLLMHRNMTWTAFLLLVEW